MDKRAFRTLMRQRRVALGNAERLRQSHLICEQLLGWYDAQRDAGLAPFSRVASVISYGTEPDTTEFVTGLHERGIEVIVPVPYADHTMRWAVWTPDVELEETELKGLSQPVGKRFDHDILTEVEAIQVPALAVDSHGHRMGQGGGFYDRVLSHLAQTLDQPVVTLSPVFSHEYYPDFSPIPTDDHDQPVNGAVTTAGIHWTVSGHEK
ncbi:5-formyltetrahydrofolate cyclo-ligase [Auritidibacter ignavus]|uniref:5-formyltetrahydrofolate cyclo-ligase n=1 Tax=Auritidibacter ignavus TaxID=678932 RepID=UPI000F0271CF|nr:5-formyltetrahydrofolate cyclo-ligase [Auritidibacter ignavus]RMX22496.1 5-formyltetrahydrofolate cyclo-ligase [Auritidibacter ignavus]WHS35352.1 5-formyltetrahydrofolate cyclo-ligase [Auritidibacter ignavus]